MRQSFALFQRNAPKFQEGKRFSSNFLSMQKSSTKRLKEALIEEQSSTNSYFNPLHISTTTKPSKVDLKKGTPEQHQVYAQIHSKQSCNPLRSCHARPG